MSREDQARHAIQQLRAVAKGSLDPIFDLISSAEATLHGTPLRCYGAAGVTMLDPWHPFTSREACLDAVIAAAACRCKT